MSTQHHSADKISWRPAARTRRDSRPDEDEGRGCRKRVARLAAKLDAGMTNRRSARTRNSIRPGSTVSPAVCLRTSPARLRDERPGRSISISDRCRGRSTLQHRPLVFPPEVSPYSTNPWNIDNHAPTACKGLTGWYTTRWIVLRASRGKKIASWNVAAFFFSQRFFSRCSRQKVKRQDFFVQDSCLILCLLFASMIDQYWHVSPKVLKNWRDGKGGWFLVKVLRYSEHCAYIYIWSVKTIAFIVPFVFEKCWWREHSFLLLFLFCQERVSDVYFI